jgi:hypothetical protein
LIGKTEINQSAQIREENIKLDHNEMEWSGVVGHVVGTAESA